MINTILNAFLNYSDGKYIPIQSNSRSTYHSCTWKENLEIFASSLTNTFPVLFDGIINWKI